VVHLVAPGRLDLNGLVLDTVEKFLQVRSGEREPALLFGDRTWSWHEYAEGARARGAAVHGLLDGARPRHVGVLLENTPEMAFALSAGAYGGHVTVGLNLTRRGTALSRDIVAADCQVVLTDGAHLPLLDGLDLRGVQVIDTDGPEWAERVTAGTSSPMGHQPVAGSDTFMLIFTSGTSGAPKAVKVSHEFVVTSGRMLGERFGIGRSDVCYVSMPLFHSNAVVAGYGVALCSGAAMALAPRFSASGFLPDVRRYGATYMNYVGKPLAYILRTPHRDDDADNPLRIAFGNEASDRDIAEFAARFGVHVVDGFGSTENGVVVSRVPGTPPGSIGMPQDGVAVYDRATRTECPRAVFDASGRVLNLDDAVGELVNTAGAGFFRGYYNDDEATAERMADGMYWSGDLAYRDEAGFVYYVGRTSDWLRVDGENLGAGVIEEILLRHPAVSQAAVYGIRDPDSGDQLVAALVLRDRDGLDPAGFERFLAAQQDLSTKGWPRHVRIVPALPSTATNKVLKRELVREGLAGECWERAERGTAYTPLAGVPSAAPPG
jgi:fatty-acyl-CoA synthase